MDIFPVKERIKAWFVKNQGYFLGAVALAIIAGGMVVSC